MDKGWIEANIYLKDYDAFINQEPENKLRLIHNMLSPLVRELEDAALIKTFHFLFEPFVLFRVRLVDTKDKAKVTQLIEEKVATCGIIEKLEYKDAYVGEAERFGELNWQLVQHFLELSSRISFRMVEAGSDDPNKFNDSKLIHCYLNCRGHCGDLQEEHFYVRRLSEVGFDVDRTLGDLL